MSPVQEFVSTEMGDSAPVSVGASAPLPPSEPECVPAARLCLRCFVYQAGDGLYRAECIDLDIGTEAETLERAVEGLGDAIYGYLMVVLEDVKTNEEMPAAVLRPAPLSHRLHYFACYAIHKLLSLFHRDEKRRFYRKPYGLSNAHYCS